MITPQLKRLFIVTALAVVAALGVFFYRHHNDGPNPAMPSVQTASMVAGPVTEEGLNTALTNAKLPINGLAVRLTDGVTVVRGRTSDPAAIAAAVELLRQLGAPRIMNVIRLEARNPDDEIARAAERRLVTSPGLEGCRFSVQSRNGVLQINGTIYSDLQRETALRAVRQIDGVSEVKTDLKRAAL